MEPVWDGNKIKKARRKLGLTQTDLAEGLGCRQQTISEWEQGDYLPKNAYQRLLSAFFASAEHDSALGECE